MTSGTALVVGHARDAASRDALDAAADLARRLHAHLHVVHAVNLEDYPVDPDTADWERRADQAVAAERAEAGRVLEESGVGWTYHAPRGDPVESLCAVADEHDVLMIVLGTGGILPALQRLLAPSVSHGVIRRRSRPVLVVPARADG